MATVQSLEEFLSDDNRGVGQDKAASAKEAARRRDKLNQQMDSLREAVHVVGDKAVRSTLMASYNDLRKKRDQYQEYLDSIFMTCVEPDDPFGVEQIAMSNQQGLTPEHEVLPPTPTPQPPDDSAVPLYVANAGKYGSSSSPSGFPNSTRTGTSRLPSLPSTAWSGPERHRYKSNGKPNRPSGLPSLPPLPGRAARGLDPTSQAFEPAGASPYAPRHMPPHLKYQNRSAGMPPYYPQHASGPYGQEQQPRFFPTPLIVPVPTGGLPQDHVDPNKFSEQEKLVPKVKELLFFHHPVELRVDLIGQFYEKFWESSLPFDSLVETFKFLNRQDHVSTTKDRTGHYRFGLDTKSYFSSLDEAQQIAVALKKMKRVMRAFPQGIETRHLQGIVEHFVGINFHATPPAFQDKLFNQEDGVLSVYAQGVQGELHMMKMRDFGVSEDRLIEDPRWPLTYKEMLICVLSEATYDGLEAHRLESRFDRVFTLPLDLRSTRIEKIIIDICDPVLRKDGRYKIGKTTREQNKGWIEWWQRKVQFFGWNQPVQRPSGMPPVPHQHRQYKPPHMRRNGGMPPVPPAPQMRKPELPAQHQEESGRPRSSSPSHSPSSGLPAVPPVVGGAQRRPETGAADVEKGPVRHKDRHKVFVGGFTRRYKVEHFISFLKQRQLHVYNHPVIQHQPGRRHGFIQCLVLGSEEEAERLIRLSPIPFNEFHLEVKPYLSRREFRKKVARANEQFRRDEAARDTPSPVVPATDECKDASGADGADE